MKIKQSKKKKCQTKLDTYVQLAHRIRREKDVYTPKSFIQFISILLIILIYHPQIEKQNMFMYISSNVSFPLKNVKRLII